MLFVQRKCCKRPLVDCSLCQREIMVYYSSEIQYWAVCSDGSVLYTGLRRAGSRVRIPPLSVKIWTSTTELLSVQHVILPSTLYVRPPPLFIICIPDFWLTIMPVRMFLTLDLSARETSVSNIGRNNVHTYSSRPSYNSEWVRSTELVSCNVVIAANQSLHCRPTNAPWL